MLEHIVFSPGAIALCALGALLWVSGLILRPTAAERQHADQLRRIYAEFRE